MATPEEKSERLKKILAGIAKPQKRQLQSMDQNDKEKDEQDKIDEDLLRKLKLAEEKFNRKKQGLGLKKQIQQSLDELTYDDIHELGDGHESQKTAYLFILTIVTMIASMFCIMGILLISVLVYLADDEIQLLHELSGESAHIFKQELRETKVLFPFIIQVLACATNIYLITLEHQDELWFYVRKRLNGLNIISVAVMGQFLVFTSFCFMYSNDLAHKHHVLTNLVTLAQLIAILVTARSKVMDLTKAKAEMQKQLNFREDQFQKYMKTYQRLNDKLS